MRLSVRKRLACVACAIDASVLFSLIVSPSLRFWSPFHLIFVITVSPNILLRFSLPDSQRARMRW